MDKRSRLAFYPTVPGIPPHRQAFKAQDIIGEFCFTEKSELISEMTVKYSQITQRITIGITESVDGFFLFLSAFFNDYFEFITLADL